MARVHFDLDVLRSFVTGMELGSFAKAADRLGRSTSAISAQLKKLEDQAGAPVLRRQGRAMVLTETGETMLAYARRLLELNDEAAAALRGADLAGAVRLGLQEDFGESLLPDVLGRFARAHPKLRVEVRMARNRELLDGLEGGRLDLALAWHAGRATPHHERIAELPMHWIGPAEGELSWEPGEPLPLVSLDAPCMMRTAAIEALDRAGIPWRVAFTSASLAGIWAAVAAGLGLGMRTPAGLPAHVRISHRADLPPLPRLGLELHRANAEPAPPVARLNEILRQALQPLASITA